MILIAISNGGVTRIDTALGAEQSPRTFSALGDALRKLPKRAEVLVLSDAAFKQNVSFPAPQAAGLNDAELSRALAFEIEPFSGIPAAQSLIAFLRREKVGGTQNFLALQLAASEAQEISAAVRKARGNLLGFGALPAAENLGGFLALAENLANEVIIPAPRKTSSAKKSAAIALCALLALAAAAAIHYAQTKSAANELAEKWRARKAAMQLLENAGAENANLKKSLTSAAAPAALWSAERRKAWAALLGALSSSFAQDAAIRKTTLNGAFDITFHAVAASEFAADSALKKLDAEVAPAGWIISPISSAPSPTGKTQNFSFNARAEF